MNGFKSTTGKHTVVISGSVGKHNKPYVDPNTGDQDVIRLDLYGQYPEPSAITNVRLQDVIDALNKIEGVEATYTPPKPRISAPRGLGAIVVLSPETGFGRMVRTGELPGETPSNTWTHAGTSGRYTDADIEFYLNESEVYPNCTIITEGEDL